jgi:galactonate dehydratase
MKITNLETFVAGAEWLNLMFIRLDTDEGISGCAEATAHNKTAATLAYFQEAAPRYVIGSDPFDIEDLFARMFRLDYSNGGAVQATVMSAVEIACWDIIGKKLGQPVWRLLGGKCRDRVPAYANGWYTVNRDPLMFAARAREVVRKGYRGIKFDPFGAGGLEMSRQEKMSTIGLVEAVRDAVGPDIEIFIEAHGRMSPATSVAMAHALERFDPAWYEEPVPPEDIEALLFVKNHIGIPVATGERCHTRYEFRGLIERRAADILQPDVTHAGGLLETKKIAAMAEPCYMTVAPHNSSGPGCTAASVHLAVCTPNFKIQETFDDYAEPWVNETVRGAPQAVNGYFELPTRPGLGIELDESVIRAHPPKAEFFNLWDPQWHKRTTWRPRNEND